MPKYGVNPEFFDQSNTMRNQVKDYQGFFDRISSMVRALHVSQYKNISLTPVKA